MILFFAFVNLLASIAGNSLMPAMILSRTGNNQKILGLVFTCLGIGTLVGSGKGAGMALIFLLTGVIGFLINILALKAKTFNELDL